MKKISILLVLILISACSDKKEIPEILESKFETLVISDDFSSPAIKLEENHLREILILLHNDIPDEGIREYFRMSEAAYKSAINDLYGEGLIKRMGSGKFVPACMVIDSENGERMKKTADSLGREMSLIVIDRLEKIKEAYGRIPAFKNIPFGNASLFILGNAVYNYWQMPSITGQFLKANPPRRGAGRYYMAVLENKEGGSEPFGLFFNKFLPEDNYMAGVYGNNIPRADSILNSTALSALSPKSGISIPVFTQADQKKLSELASVVTPDILAYLEKNRTLFVKLYLNSVYKDQTSFREWFVWYYQFMITRSNKTLIEKGYIKTPASMGASFLLSR
ncbi:MAG: hypothetical protein WC061_07020 [Melioribacteraceae bacterium]